ncbi:MAG: hypothetical protein PHO09_05335 [Sphaerochaeta sp.]|nr:hypothetical protein [Sphaerochaeta sp.]
MEIVEKLTTLEGTLEIQQNIGEKPTLYLVMQDGTKTEILLSEEAVLQLQLQNREKIQIEGIFLGSSKENKIQEKLFARMVIRNQERISVDNPVQLSEQERTQLRTFQEYQQVQMKNQVQTEEQSSGSNGNAGSNSNKK